MDLVLGHFHGVQPPLTIRRRVFGRHDDERDYDEPADEVAEVDQTPVLEQLSPADAVGRLGHQGQGGGSKQLGAEQYAQNETEGETETADQLGHSPGHAARSRGDGDIEHECDGDESASRDGQRNDLVGRLGGLGIGDVFSQGGDGFGLQTIKGRFCFQFSVPAYFACGNHNKGADPQN
ncbi:hypothetical protein D3C84_676240 [compost metagenome]